MKTDTASSISALISKPDSGPRRSTGGAWFGAELLNPQDFALVGCTVAPGFEFEHFELADRAHFLEKFPDQRSIIERLTSPR